VSAAARWGIVVAGLGFSAVGVSIALWSMPGPGDVWTVVALAALRLLAAFVVGGLTIVAVLARHRSGEDGRPVGPAPVVVAVAEEAPT
jgi:hypothetical protein